MLVILEIGTLVITLIFIIVSIKHINNSSIFIYHIIFALLTAMPLLLDYIIGVPNYSVSYPGFTIACFDPATRVLYCLYILLIQCIIFINVKRKKLLFNIENFDDSIANEMIDDYSVFQSMKFRRLLVFICLISPILALAFRMPLKYMVSWSWRYEGFNTGIITGYGTLERLSYVGIVAAAIVFVKERSLFFKIISSVCLYLNICIEGKRSALFFGLLVFIIVFQMLGNPKTKKWIIGLFGTVVIAVIINISVNIQMTYRDYTSFDELYRMLRVDFFRDDTIKFAIYCMAHPNEIQILSYPFQSLVMQIGFFFPLVWLGIPKIGYETYMTAALKFRTVETLSNSVRMTVSLYDCLIANFGIMGFLLGAYVIIFFSDRTDEVMQDMKPIWISGFVLYSMYSLSYICWYFEFWIIAIFCYKHVRIVRRKV